MKNLLKITVALTLLMISAGELKAQESREEQVARLKAKIAPALNLSIGELQLALSIKVHEKYNGASIIADDGERTFLGMIGNETERDSIFNDIGQHGGEIARHSIWNEIGRYGGAISRHSPFNEFSSSPPFIVKNGKVIGRLTVNKFIAGAVDPFWLRSFYK